MTSIQMISKIFMFELKLARINNLCMFYTNLKTFKFQNDILIYSLAFF